MAWLLNGSSPPHVRLQVNTYRLGYSLYPINLYPIGKRCQSASLGPKTTSLRRCEALMNLGGTSQLIPWGHIS